MAEIEKQDTVSQTRGMGARREEGRGMTTGGEVGGGGRGVKCLWQSWLRKLGLERRLEGASLAVQWLGHCASNAGGVGSISGRRTGIQCAHVVQKKKEKKTWNELWAQSSVGMELNGVSRWREQSNVPSILLGTAFLGSHSEAEIKLPGGWSSNYFSLLSSFPSPRRWH